MDEELRSNQTIYNKTIEELSVKDLKSHIEFVSLKENLKNNNNKKERESQSRNKIKIFLGNDRNSINKLMKTAVSLLKKNGKLNKIVNVILLIIYRIIIIVLVIRNLKLTKKLMVLKTGDAGISMSPITEKTILTPGTFIQYNLKKRNDSEGIYVDMISNLVFLIRKIARIISGNHLWVLCLL